MKLNQLQKNALIFWAILVFLVSMMLFSGATNGGSFLSGAEQNSMFLVYINHGLIPGILISSVITFIGFGLYALTKKK